MAELAQPIQSDHKVKTYEYRCSHEYLQRRALQPMFIVEKKTEETYTTSETPASTTPAEKIVICAACSEICYNRVKAKPLVSYREMSCQCHCKKDVKVFDKERKLYTKDILRQDAMISLHAALTSALVSCSDTLAKCRVYPMAEPENLIRLVEALGISSDIYDMKDMARTLARNLHVPGELCPGAYIAGTLASSFLARDLEARVAVDIPLQSKIISGRSCRWYLQVNFKNEWHEIKFLEPHIDPASQRVWITVVIDIYGFITAHDVSALSAAAVSTLARKLLEYDTFRRMVVELPDMFTTTDANLMLLERSMGKSVTSMLNDFYQTDEAVIAEVCDIHRRLTAVARRDGTRDPQELDYELKALMDMYENENFSCTLLASWMNEWGHHSTSALAEYLRITFIKWSAASGPQAAISRLAPIGIVSAFEGAMKQTLHDAMHVQLIFLEFVRHLFDKFTSILIAQNLWFSLIGVLQRTVTQHGLTWAEPVVYLIGVTVRTAARGISQLHDEQPTQDWLPFINALIPMTRQIVELDDPATIISTIEVLKVIMTDRFSQCFSELCIQILPVLQKIVHRPKNLRLIIDTMEKFQRQQAAA